jgi:NAD-dependent dihydropyrimidine dehydrogenase PreA subunit
MTKREILDIDEEKCNGCGQCIPPCVEGAIRIIDGKARLTAEKYCDGLGACVERCPQEALKIIEREAEDFEEIVLGRC